MRKNLIILPAAIYLLKSLAGNYVYLLKQLLWQTTNYDLIIFYQTKLHFLTQTLQQQRARDRKIQSALNLVLAQCTISVQLKSSAHVVLLM